MEKVYAFNHEVDDVKVYIEEYDEEKDNEK